MRILTLALCLLASLTLAAQESESKLKVKGLRDWAKEGSPALEKVVPYLVDADPEVRREATRAIVAIGTQRSLDPLIRATRDEDAEVQIRAVDGIVNFYFPGYAEKGMSSRLKKGSLPASTLRDESTQVIDPDMPVRAEIVESLARLVASGAPAPVRANAARALGALRGKAASRVLLDALKSKDDGIMFEAIIALQKIGDPANGPGIAFLTRDLDQRVQLAAIETVGLLRSKEAIPQLRRALESGDKKVRRAVYLALARIADASTHDALAAALVDKDEEVRAAAAEGLGRLGNAENLPRVEELFSTDSKQQARLAAAFGAVALGKFGIAESDPLRYLMNTLNQRAWRGVAQPYLSELSLKKEVRQAIYMALDGQATRDEKIGVAMALAGSGGKDAAAVLERLARDPDAEVGREALRALRILRSSL